MNRLEERFQEWILTDPDSYDLIQTNARIVKFADVLYSEYEPTRGPYPDFWQRLEAWLDNVNDEADQKTLFKLLPQLLFIGPREFDSLYRVAYRNGFVRWIIDLQTLNVKATDLDSQVATAVQSTWFCPITDSMRINAFYHLNRVTGRDFRPDWRSLAQFGSEDRINAFMSTEGISRLVLLEDFVGTGSQIYDAVDFAGRLTPSIPILVIFLVTCPAAVTTIRTLQSNYPHITFAPVLTLRDNDFIIDPPEPNEPPLYADIRKIATATFDRLKAGLSPQELGQLYAPLGFGSTGGLIVLYTNCPDNTLPLVHRKSNEWHALFPRASRL
jgi:hypothetical protein